MLLLNMPTRSMCDDLDTLALYIDESNIPREYIPLLMNICVHAVHRCTLPSASMTNLPCQSPQRVEYLHKCRQENRFKKCHTQSHLIDDRKCFKRNLRLQFGAILCEIFSVLFMENIQTRYRFSPIIAETWLNLISWFLLWFSLFTLPISK